MKQHFYRVFCLSDSDIILNRDFLKYPAYIRETIWYMKASIKPG